MIESLETVEERTNTSLPRMLVSTFTDVYDERAAVRSEAASGRLLVLLLCSIR